MGRPRSFEIDVALQAALDMFWQQGYAATSLDDLTAAMGLSRSSFYGAFGSKHAVLIAAVTRYVDGIYAALQAIAASEPDAAVAVGTVFDSLASARGGDAGCLLVNSISELAPGDPDVSALAHAHICRVLALLKALLAKAGHPARATESVAGALLSCAFGAAILRKAGLSAESVAGLTAQARHLAEQRPGRA